MHPTAFPLSHATSHNRKGRRRSGLTLVEVVVAMGILGIVLGGILGGFVLVRRFTEACICQNVATNVVQGYLEQIRGLAWGANFYSGLPLSPSSTTAAYTAGTAGRTISTVTSTGAFEDTFSVTINGVPITYTLLTVSKLPAPTSSDLTVSNTFPNAVANVRYPVINANSDTKMPMTIWVWIEDKTSPSPANPDTESQIKAITIVYKWTVGSGSKAKTYINSIRTMCANVPTV